MVFFKSKKLIYESASIFDKIFVHDLIYPLLIMHSYWLLKRGYIFLHTHSIADFAYFIVDTLIVSYFVSVIILCRKPNINISPLGCGS